MIKEERKRKYLIITRVRIKNMHLSYSSSPENYSQIHGIDIQYLQ